MDKSAHTKGILTQEVYFMGALLKKIRLNTLLSNGLWGLLGAALLFWPAPSARAVCLALGAVLLLCGAGNLAAALPNRDGTLYTALRLGSGVILAVVGLWLLFRPLLAAALIPKLIGILLCIHGISNLGDALVLRRVNDRRWSAAALAGGASAALGLLLLFLAIPAFLTAVRIVGICLLCDGISGLWIGLRLGKISPPNEAPT